MNFDELNSASARFQKKTVPGKSRNVSTVFSQTVAGPAEGTRSKSRTPSRVNFSNFKTGFTLDSQYKPTKKIIQGVSGRSTVSFDPPKETPPERKTSQHRRSLSPLSQYSTNNIRNPIIGVAVKPEEGIEVPLDARSS